MRGQEFTIEKFSITMYERVYKLWELGNLTLGSSDTKERIQKVAERNPETFLVGKIGEEIIAVVMGMHDGFRGYIYHLVVDPKFRSKGYGNRLMQELHAIYTQLGILKIHVLIEKRNKQVQEFYDKVGWHKRDDLMIMSYIPDNDAYSRNPN
ncbi:MAG: GNAT family N-acetyltransferase [Promethearchaeota archaeon]|nr:MAG: GNAT family N-acetyltransferase [Candidatus Lokiarchaeota archaeon]